MTTTQTRPAAPTPATTLDTEFTRGLGLYDSTMVVVGSMIGSGIFLVSADMAQNDWQPGVAAGGVGADGRPHHCRRAVVRRTRRHDAARRRPVRLHSRGVLATVGISLRLDAVSRHPDRNDCCRRGRVRSIFRRVRAVDCRRSLFDTAASPQHRLRRVAVDDTAGWRGVDCAAHLDEHARARIRPDHSEHLHHHQERRVGGADSARPFRRPKQRGGIR